MIIRESKIQKIITEKKKTSKIIEKIFYSTQSKMVMN